MRVDRRLVVLTARNGAHLRNFGANYEYLRNPENCNYMPGPASPEPKGKAKAKRGAKTEVRAKAKPKAQAAPTEQAAKGKGKKGGK